jgi:hypothetical protein
MTAVTKMSPDPTMVVKAAHKNMEGNESLCKIIKNIENKEK